MSSDFIQALLVDGETRPSQQEPESGQVCYLLWHKAGDKRDPGSIPGSGRSPGIPLQDSCLENSHGQRSLVGHSPWGRQESDTIEQLNKNNNKFERLDGSDPSLGKSSEKLVPGCIAKVNQIGFLN